VTIYDSPLSVAHDNRTTEMCIDRRFDRLRRTKASKASGPPNDGIRAGFANVNRQLESLNHKIDGVLRAFTDKYHHGTVLNEHEGESRFGRQIG
jgi:hypothetical protein